MVQVHSNAHTFQPKHDLLDESTRSARRSQQVSLRFTPQETPRGQRKLGRLDQTRLILSHVGQAVAHCMLDLLRDLIDPAVWVEGGGGHSRAKPTTPNTTKSVLTMQSELSMGVTPADHMGAMTVPMQPSVVCCKKQGSLFRVWTLHYNCTLNPKPYNTRHVSASSLTKWMQTKTNTPPLLELGSHAGGCQGCNTCFIELVARISE